eukprot:3345803-Pleurochrysis_carterae.AAC.3
MQKQVWKRAGGGINHARAAPHSIERQQDQNVRFRAKTPALARTRGVPACSESRAHHHRIAQTPLPALQSSRIFGVRTHPFFAACLAVEFLDRSTKSKCRLLEKLVLQVVLS